MWWILYGCYMMFMCGGENSWFCKASLRICYISLFECRGPWMPPQGLLSPRDIEILGWCPAATVLSHGRRCLFSLGWQPFWWWCHNENAFWVRCFTSTSFAPHLFLLGRLKLNLTLLLDQLETDIGKWTLVVAVISVDAYPFLAFWDQTCHLKDTGICVFWLHCAA